VYTPVRAQHSEQGLSTKLASPSTSKGINQEREPTLKKSPETLEHDSEKNWPNIAFRKPWFVYIYVGLFSEHCT